MEDNRSLFTVYKSEAQKNIIIMDNIVTMLSNRIYIDKEGNKQPLLDYNTAINQINDNGNNTFTITANTGDVYAIKIIYQKILATGKQSIINEFMNEYADDNKIIVANDFNNKTVDFVVREGAQIFKEKSLMSNIILNKDQPIFELLSPKEMQEIKEEYDISSYSAPKISRNDPVAKYYALKKNDFIRVINSSPTAGLNVSYQVVS